jgi:hypothetical protein
MKYIKRFEPIESDPQILTKLMHCLGIQETFWFDNVLDEIRAASLKLKPGGPIQAPGPVFNFALISIRD